MISFFLGFACAYPIHLVGKTKSSLVVVVHMHSSSFTCICFFCTDILFSTLYSHLTTPSVLQLSHRVFSLPLVSHHPLSLFILLLLSSFRFVVLVFPLLRCRVSSHLSLSRLHVYHFKQHRLYKPIFPFSHYIVIRIARCVFGS